LWDEIDFPREAAICRSSGEALGDLIERVRCDLSRFQTAMPSPQRAALSLQDTEVIPYYKLSMGHSDLFAVIVEELGGKIEHVSRETASRHPVVVNCLGASEERLEVFLHSLGPKIKHHLVCDAPLPEHLANLCLEVCLPTSFRSLCNALRLTEKQTCADKIS
jgi:hypothetical protein